MSAALEALAEALAPIMAQKQARQFGFAQKHDTATVNPSGTIYSHGPAGMLTYPGVDPVVWNAMMGADSIINQIPFVPSVYTNPTYLTITGVRDVTGSEQNNVCDPAPVAGLMKACMVTSVFGRYSRQTETIDLTRIGKRTDRSDPLDLRLQNSPISVGNPFVGGGDVSMNFADLLTNETARKFWERNIAFQRLLAKQLWVGNPVNNSANGGYMELSGLQVLVNTGYVDAIANTTCPSIDSYVRNFNYGRVDTPTGTSNVIAALTDMWHQLNERARRADVLPVRWVLAMRSQLFYEITKVWPCSYLTMNCATSVGNSAVVDAADAVRFRDEMRAGSFLWMDGVKVEVVHDDGIPEKDGNSSAGLFPRGCFSSDVYFLPMSIAGGRSVLYGEYFQYSNPSTVDALGNMVLGRIEGAFITFPMQTRNCVNWLTTVEPRLVLRTPWLAGRLQNVTYCPIQHEPEPFPTDPYYVNGGVSTRTSPLTDYHDIWG